jgi:hypothetical protein
MTRRFASTPDGIDLDPPASALVPLQPATLDRSGAVLGGPGEGAGYRHIWMTIGPKTEWPGPRVYDGELATPLAMCGAVYDGRAVEPGANKELPVCERCKALIDNHNRGAKLGGRIEVR